LLRGLLLQAELVQHSQLGQQHDVLLVAVLQPPWLLLLLILVGHWVARLLSTH
jgi:hypothetical protein